MTWPCFMLETVGHATEYVVGHGHYPDSHRVVIQYLDDVDYETASYAPESGWPDSCPTCGVELDYEGADFDTGWRTRIGLTKYRRVGTDEIHTHPHEFGPGAMFDAAPYGPGTGPDGRSLAVILPPGGQSDVWYIDGPASSGGHWTRSGDAPNLTVSPSILTPNYHGFLQNGVLTDPL